MQLRKTYAWISPMKIARYFAERESEWVFFFSGQQTSYSGELSIIAYDLDKKIAGESFTELEKALTHNAQPLDNAWFGYVGYEMKNQLETLPKTQASKLTFPALSFARYNNIILFHHHTQKIELWSNNDSAIDDMENAQKYSNIDNTPNFPAPLIHSNMSKQDYLEKVEHIQQAIKNGILSQANLTRKFNGELPSNIPPFMLFKKLCNLSPSPYSCYVQNGDRHILSSSPEKFISLDDKGNAITRPIKGTISRSPDPKIDKQHYTQLQNSSKDKAENLMIVDLMRNDFSRSCKIASVTVPSLFEITSHASVHHMSSTILGKKREDVSALTLFKNCFPPGSMTGTPKIKAMQLCAELEKENRGVYSGAIAWFKGDGSFDSSVVIRTLLIENNHFEFQVGGAIVYDSDPESEWQETIIKAKDICATLNYPLEQLKAI